MDFLSAPPKYLVKVSLSSKSVTLCLFPPHALLSVPPVRTAPTLIPLFLRLSPSLSLAVVRAAVSRRRRRRRSLPAAAAHRRPNVAHGALNLPASE